MTTAIKEHSHGAVAGTKQAPAKTRAALIQSHDVADFPLLTGREEEWRFTPVRRLRGLHKGDVAPSPTPARYEYEPAPPGVTIERVSMKDSRIGSVLTPFDRPSAQAFAETAEALMVSIEPATRVAEPIVVNLVGTTADGASYSHAFVEVGESAEVTLVLDERGSTTLADNVELSLAPGAQVKVVSIADWSADAVQLQHQRARLERDSSLTHIAVTLGGNVVRVYLSAEFAGPGAEVDAYGLYFADAGQHLEHRLLIDHAVPNCRSRVTYRGALQGEDAHTVWVGDVLIQDQATGTDTYEVNRNLILTDGARADSVPNLEIETGEIVGAGHASATGRFDDEQLFYLQSRGIPADEARRLVVRGFFGELVSKIGIPEIEERLIASIEERLSKAGS